MILDVDCFGIDLEILFNADNRNHGRWNVRDFKQILVEEVIKNLTVESKKILREYQEGE